MGKAKNELDLVIDVIQANGGFRGVTSPSERIALVYAELREAQQVIERARQALVLPAPLSGETHARKI